MMIRIFSKCLLIILLACSAKAHAQEGVFGVIGYGMGKFVYRPANLDIVRYNLDKASDSPMDFPDYIKGMSYGLKINFDEHGSGEFFFNRRKATGSVTDTLGNSYDLRCSVSSFTFGGSFGLRMLKLGVAFNMGTFAISSRLNKGSWENLFESKRKLWFGHSVYLSFLLPLGEAAIFEVRPYWETSWFSVRMGHSLPLVAFRPSHFGVMVALALGGT